jgi:hypothetical protein
MVCRLRNQRQRIVSPLHALASGLIAGAVGTGVQNVFFAATKGLSPEPPRAAFRPPEPEQSKETEPETVARRVVEGLAQRPIDPAWKSAAGTLVHFTFGAGWGALYGIALGAYPRRRGPLTVLAFSTVVWAASDNVILPALRLAGPPTAYPVKTHAYALAAHLAYGGAVWAAFELMRGRTFARAIPPLLAVASRVWLRNRRRQALHAIADVPRGVVRAMGK